ncbi:sulfur globule protein precursor [Phreatobacter sp.]|uniref:sulfur globule protein precursor n=1 Tax=Phreatobacter sp. TaxID=1966341 RepID=UPI003F6F716C
MRKFLLPALAGLAALGAAAFTPSRADAQVSIGIGIGPAPLAVQYGGGWHRPHYGYGRPHGYPRPHGYYRPHYGAYRPYPVAPTCWVERRWVETPWGPEPRRVRICR